MIGVSCLASLGHAEVILRLLDRATVVGPRIRLGDIAEVTSAKGKPNAVLSNLDVGRAAPPGKTAVFTRSGLILSLRREDLFQPGMKFGGADRCLVLTQSQKLEPEGLLPDIQNFVQKQTGEDPGFLAVGFEGSPKSLVLPAGDVTVRLKPNVSGRYEGIMTLQADLSVDGRFIRTTTFRIRVDRFRPVVKTTRAVEKGEKFTSKNVALARFPGNFSLKGGFTDLKQVLGRFSSSALAPETMLRVTDLYDPPVIVHGRVVEAVVRKGNVEISVQVRAIEDGKMGDVIRVENTDSHKILKGKVLDEKKVLVEGS